MMAVIHAGADM